MNDLHDEQLLLGDFDLPSSLGEMTYLAVSGAWRHTILERPDGSMAPRVADEISFAALLLAVEHGQHFTRKSLRDTSESREIASHSRSAWLDERLWDLCEAGISNASPNDSDAASQVTEDLDHHSSSIRWWHLEVGWFIKTWLNPSDAVPRLLSNLASALRGPFESAALAAAMVGSEDEFLSGAEAYEPDPRFARQYLERLEKVRDFGTSILSAHFFRLESRARMITTTAAFGANAPSGSHIDNARDAVLAWARTQDT